MGLENLQEHRLHNLSGKPVPMINYPIMIFFTIYLFQATSVFTYEHCLILPPLRILVKNLAPFSW